MTNVQKMLKLYATGATVQYVKNYISMGKLLNTLKLCVSGPGIWAAAQIYYIKNCRQVSVYAVLIVSIVGK